MKSDDKYLPQSVQSVNIRRMSNETDTAFNYRLLKLIERRPEISQRELAAELGLSLGKINYCLKAFVVRGLVKVDNFCRSDNKRAYAYLLTPKGIEGEARVTVRFFKRVETEYETLKQERASILDLTPLILPRIGASGRGQLIADIFGGGLPYANLHYS